MSGKFSMDDYIDVAERIAEFNTRYPEGTLQTIGWSVETVGEQTFIVYRAAAYRTPDDRRPGHGTAWEPFPGRTPYTKDSELMNAETSAWGRAIVACGLTSNRKIASKQEVQVRANGNGNGNGTSQPAANNGPGPQPTAAPAQPSERPADVDQRKLMLRLAEEAELTAAEFANILLGVGGEPPRTWQDTEAPERLYKRMLDRLPAKHVDAVLKGIEGKVSR